MQNIFIVGEFINRLNPGLGSYMTHMYWILLKVFEYLQMLFRHQYNYSFENKED